MSDWYRSVLVVMAAAMAGVSVTGAAQQGGARGQAPRTPQTPPPAIQWAAPPLPDGPIAIETAEERNVRIVVTKGLSHPWGMAFLPDGAILVTERAGRLRIVRNGVLDPTPVAGLPPIAAQGLAGLLDIALHPQFATNRFVYLSYHKPVPLPPGEPAPPARGGGPPATTTRRTALARAVWNGSALTDLKEIFVNDVISEASRLVFGRDGMLYMSMGNSTEGENAPSQNPANYGGKLIRLRDDGSIPADNPFVKRDGYKPEIYTLGHRNQLGLAVHPVTGEVWAAEQGGPRVSEVPWQAVFEQPVAVWVPSIAVSGLTFYTGDRFPRWKNNLFVGGLRQGPDGLLYVLTEENDAALLRFEPGPAPAK